MDTSTVALKKAKAALKKLAKPASAEVFLRFFKTGRGEYGEGDKFLGVNVPNTRSVSRLYIDLELPEVESLLSSPLHEERLLALFILVLKFERAAKRLKNGQDKAATKEQKAVIECYLKNLASVNNWDLVDGSAPYLLGPWLMKRDRRLLYRLVRSKVLWERRIAILSTFYFIRQGEFEESLRLSEILLSDPHDLMHKAVGWMLREIGKRDLAAAEKFLKAHQTTMPRTALRYAIERFPEKKGKPILRVRDRGQGATSAPPKKLTGATLQRFEK